MTTLIIFAEVSLVIIIFLGLIWLVGKSSTLLIKYQLFHIEAQRVKMMRRNITGLLLLTGFVLCLAIGSVINYSKEYIFAVVEVCVPYNANLAQVYQVVEEVGQELQANYPDVLEPTQNPHKLMAWKV